MGEGNMFLKAEKMKLPRLNFPARWQAVLYRNYGFVDEDRLAQVLGTDRQTVRAEAAKLGLGNISFHPEWLKSGYITVIKNNWFLLDYEQLAQLLGWTEERLDYIIKEEDFLYVKLGNVKPFCEKVKYTPLSAQEKEQTAVAAKILNSCGEEEAEAFRFFDFRNMSDGAAACLGSRIIHGYITPCGDTFAADSRSYLPDDLLREYAGVGVNGLWFHALLTDLSPFPFKDLGERYLPRRKNLQELVDRCARFGIKVFLYLNEPRCIKTEDFKGQEEIKGAEVGAFSALCMGTDKVKEYLYDAVFDLFSQVNGIGGVMTITMSENLTHCHSLKGGNCPRCKDMTAYEQSAEVNNIIAKAMRDSKSGAELIANLWGWSDFMGWTEEDAHKGIDLLDKDISVLCVSEYGQPIEKGGIKSKIIDYSLSNPGPSAISRRLLEHAKERGHKTYAKIQVNNSWECSAVPYFPVFDLVWKHLENLRPVGVKNYMLSWTLGGWPSLALDMVRSFGEGETLGGWYEKTFRENADAVHEAVKFLCEGFENYPFSIQSLYYSPKTHGYANLWDLERDEKESAMVSYAFDDYEHWTEPYPYEVYLSQMKKLLNGLEKGIWVLKKIKGKDDKISEIWRYAFAEYLHFSADYDQTLFSYLKRDRDRNAAEIKEVLARAAEKTKELLMLQKLDGKIGYEASNHYFYTSRSLKEKLLNLYGLACETEEAEKRRTKSKK